MADYDAVLALWQSAGPGVSIRPSDRREEIAKKLTRDPELFLVAECGGRLVGALMGAWDGRRGWLHHLAVDESVRRQGIGAALVQEVEGRIRARGCLKVNLLVYSANQGAREFYRSLGYDEMTPIMAMGKEL
jgi:ribosomal protein S18 acetylase RimI-like enzyme